MRVHRRRQGEGAGHGDQAPQGGLKFSDLVTLGRLARRGLDHEQVQHAVYVLRLPTREAAESAATEARAHGGSAHVGPARAPLPARRVLRCGRRTVLSEGAVRKGTDLMEGIAARHGGIDLRGLGCVPADVLPGPSVRSDAC